MDERLCLRCDWTGQTEGPACPRCGAPLYRVGQAAEAPTSTAGSQPEPDVSQRDRIQAEEDEQDDRPPAPTGGGRARVIVLALTLAAASFAFALIRDGGPDPVAAQGEARALPDATAQVPTAASPPAPAGQCTAAPVPRVLTPAGAVPAPTADYLFQGSLESSVGTAPDLIAIGRKRIAYTDQEMIGSTVLSFSDNTGLALPQTRGVVSRDEYTIEILFHFDEVSNYRKILDLNNGSRDDGLYVLDGCLNFFPRPVTSSTPIEADTFAQVVLTRGSSSDAVVGYVDGIRQFVFDDQLGIAEIGRSHTLRFFVDDERTKVEHSGGVVSQIRLFDREFTADEVAALACSEVRVPAGMITCLAA